MPKRLTCVLTVGMILLASVLCAIAAAPGKKPGLRHISEDVPLDGSTEASSRLPSETGIDRHGAESMSRTSCADIDPQAGVIVAHDELDSTWYELQQNGNIGRMNIVGPDGHRGFSWMSSDGVYPPPPRYVYAKCRSEDGSYWGPTPVDLAGGSAPGYVNQSHNHDGLPVLVYHRLIQEPMEDPPPFCMLARSGFPVIPNFNHRFDLPDSIVDAESGRKGQWPRVAVKYDEGEGEDYAHVVVTEGNPAGGVQRMMAYQRCHWISSGWLECKNYVNGSTQTYLFESNQNYFDTPRPLAHFNYTCSTAPVVEVSPVSERLAIAFIKPACGESTDGCDYLGDVAYVESMVNGEDWVNGTNYPPDDDNITNYGCGYPEEERAWYDLNACYDYNDSLHIVWSTVGFPDLGYSDPSVSKLYHWSKETGTQMITSAVWGGTNPGHYSANIAKMSISAVDPVFHPPDSNFLYCIWVQFDSSDTSAGGYGNGDIYGAGSRDGGATWGPCYNLTNTKTPDCAAGDCLSEHWASLSQNMWEGNLHIQYVCDKDAGAAIIDGGAWTENPVMYLELEAWDPGPFDPDTGVRVYTGESSGDWLGHSVSGAGDGDDDGYNDILVGAPYYNSGDGKAYVYSGRTGSLIKSVNGSATELLGYCVSGAGRVNADNLDDIILGAPYYDASGADDGRAYVYRFDGSTALYTFTGEGPEDYFGWSVSGAGDVDNDGYDDLIVGAPRNDAVGYAAGRAYVYSGQDGGILYTLTAESEADGFGESVSGAGRVDDDNHDDFIVGAPDAGPDMAGRAYVYSGQTGDVLWTFDGETYNDNFGRSVSGAGDVDNDGYDDLIVGASGYDGAKGYQVGRAYVYSGQTGGLLYTFTGEADSSYFGRSVSGAGDVNDDGYDDLIVGAFGYDGLYHDAGRAYVYSGKSGTLLCTFDGEEAEDWFGMSVSGVGDIDGDGYDEVIVGAPKNDAGGDNAGRAYVFPCEAEDSFVRGDANGDEIINVGDIVYLVSYLYKNGPAPDPVWVGDCNCDEIVNVGDIVFLVSYLYKGGPEPVC